jgi:hypothetical protein
MAEIPRIYPPLYCTRIGNQAALRTSVHERTGCRDIPDIMKPVIKTRLPVISAVKFGDPFVRTAVTSTRAFCPLSVPENMTEF